MDATTRSRWSPHLRGHLLLFDERPAAQHGHAVGVRLLLVAVALESVRLAAATWLPPSVPRWLWLPLLLGLTLVAVPALAGLSLTQIGLHRWRAWSRTEKSYFLQVLVLANVLFPLVFAAPLRMLFAEVGAVTVLAKIFVPYLAFGFYQETVYRGMIQLELGRRWGAAAGVLVANVLYTFGPLHWGYFASPLSQAGPMFGAIFAIGLLFGLVFARSGNLWIVAVFHAIGNAYIVAGSVALRSSTG